MPNTVIRAGYGIIFFNTIESPYSTGFSQATSYNNYTGSAPLNSDTNPYPTGVVLPTGNTLGLATGLGQNINYNDPTHVQPRAAEYTLNIQQQLPWNTALQVAYVGSRPTRLEVSKNINALPAQYYNLGAAEVTRPWPVGSEVVQGRADEMAPGVTSDPLSGPATRPAG